MKTSVLAVMACAIEEIRRYRESLGLQAGITAPDLREARAAVAELVGAVKEKLAADDAHFGGERSHATARRVDAADARLRAALARMELSHD